VPYIQRHYSGLELQGWANEAEQEQWRPRCVRPGRVRTVLDDGGCCASSPGLGHGERAFEMLSAALRLRLSRHNICPRSNVPVIRREGGQNVVRVMVRLAVGRRRDVHLARADADGPSRRARTQNWALVPHWTKHENPNERLKTINARSESLTYVAFATLFRRHRAEAPSHPASPLSLAARRSGRACGPRSRRPNGASSRSKGAKLPVARQPSHSTADATAMIQLLRVADERQGQGRQDAVLHSQPGPVLVVR
jgi:hypothetical protein